MPLFSFRMKDGNSVIIYAPDQSAAQETLTEMGMHSTAASVRELTRFVANFALTDGGDLHTTLLDPGTLNEVSPDYPLLQSARAHSYADFGASSAGDPPDLSTCIVHSTRCASTRRFALDARRLRAHSEGFAIQFGQSANYKTHNFSMVADGSAFASLLAARKSAR